VQSYNAQAVCTEDQIELRELLGRADDAAAS
jgi:hypothetical protein